MGESTHIGLRAAGWADASSSRPNSTALTEESPPLAEVWPEVAERLRRWLCRRGVERATAEDLCQETVARVVAKAVPYADAGDLYCWSTVVAWRLFIDGQRRERRLVHDIPDAEAPVDVPREVEARDRFSRLAACFPRLSVRERAVLLSDATGDTRTEQSRLAQQRHRARGRLLALMEGVASVLALLWARARSVRSAAVVAIAPAALLVASLTALPHVANMQSGRPRDYAPVVSSVPASVVPRAEPAVRRSGSGTTGVPARTPAPAGRVEVEIPTPLGPTSAGSRPKELTDHFLCTVDLLLIGSQCIDLPIQLTE